MSKLINLSQNLATKIFVNEFHQLATLPNQMKVGTQQIPGSKTATVGIWINAGSSFENDSTNGVAHFLEHMAFKGTKKRSEEEIEFAVENSGSQLNAYTGREQTCFWAKCFSDQLPLCVDIIADILQYPNHNLPDIERERSTILREKQQIENSVQEFVFDYAHKAAYGPISLGRTIIGPVQNIKSIGATDLTNYISTHYTAPRIHLLASGDVEQQQLETLAAEKFTHLNAGEDNFQVEKPQWKGGIESKDFYNIEHTHIVTAFETLGWSSPDYYTFIIIQALLGDWSIMGGRSFTETQFTKELKDKELVHSMQAFNTSYHKAGMVGFSAAVLPHKASDFMKVASETFQKIYENTTEAEINTAKEKLIASVVMQRDGTHPVAEDMARQILTLGRQVTTQEAAERIRSIELADVKRLLLSSIREQRPAVAIMGAGLKQFPDYDKILNWGKWK